MKLSAALLFSTSLMGMVSAGYLVKQVPANKALPQVGHKSPALRRRGCDNSQCTPPGDMGCYTSTRHSLECGVGNDFCWIVPRDCAALCNCCNPTLTLLDSCARGTPGTDKYMCNCIYECGKPGETGNGLCTAKQDVCKAS